MATAAPIRVLLLGDSITAGAVAGEGTPYATLLAEDLAGTHEIVNLGCGGTSSLDWSGASGASFCGAQGIVAPDLFEGRVQPELPAEIATVLLGTNDAIGFFEPDPVAPEAYGAALAELVSQLFTNGVGHAVLMTPPPLLGSPFANLRVVEYRQEIFALCATDARIVCGPDLFELLDADGITAADIHPTGAGHAQIAGALAEALLAVPEPGPGPAVAGGLLALALWRRRARRGPVRLGPVAVE